MKEDKRDKDVTKEAVGDPAFYNDQIDKDNIPGNSIGNKRKQDQYKAAAREKS